MRLFGAVAALAVLVAIWVAMPSAAQAHGGPHEPSGAAWDSGSTPDHRQPADGGPAHCHPGGASVACPVAVALHALAGPPLDIVGELASVRPALPERLTGQSLAPPNPPPIRERR